MKRSDWNKGIKKELPEFYSGQQWSIRTEFRQEHTDSNVSQVRFLTLLSKLENSTNWNVKASMSNGKVEKTQMSEGALRNCMERL